MPRPTLVLDGLWLSLCPSFNQLALSSRTCLPRQRNRTPDQLLRVNRSAPGFSRRCYSNEPQDKTDIHSPIGSSYPRSFRRKSYYSYSPETPENGSTPRSNHDPHEVEVEDEDGSIRMKSVRRYQIVPESYSVKSNTELENMLRQKTAKNPYVKNTTQVLRALIWDRKVEPHTRHYQSLILANCDARMGSPEIVRSLLQEMEENNITADSGTLHAALKALAVHPDYILRQEILRKLRDRWLTLSPDGWHFTVAGLLREHQFELALDQISLMERKGIHIENWLHSMAIYQLCDFEEFDEVYRLIKTRVEQGHDMTPQLWDHVLTLASRNFHYDLTCFIWRRLVNLQYLHPEFEVCLDALNIASDAGDIRLAIAIFRFCETNGYTLGGKEYQKVIRIYQKTGDFRSIFSVLCTMHEHGLQIDVESTQGVVSAMIDHNTNQWQAWGVLNRMKSWKRKIPIECVQIVAGIWERLAKTNPEVVKDAVGYYKELYRVYPQGADVNVYNALVRMCRGTKDRESALFLVKEMASLGVPPNSDTFESLILLCLDARNYQSAFKYLEDLLRLEGGEVSEKTKAEIRDLCLDSLNEFAVRIQSHAAIRDPHQQDPQQKVEPPVKRKRPHRRYGRTWYHAAYRRKMLPHEKRVAWNKKRRQNKRKYQAIAEIRAARAADLKGYSLPDF